VTRIISCLTNSYGRFGAQAAIEKVISYVTDTTAATDADYIEKIRDVNLLVHECYFPDSKAKMAKLTGHSCLTPVLEVARAANVGQLVLVHMDPKNDSPDPVGLSGGRDIFPAAVLGEDKMELEF